VTARHSAVPASDAASSWGLDRQRGQAVIWVAVFTPFFLAIVGLALDGGLVFDQEQGLQLLARTAARVGAEQVDRQAYYASQGATLTLDVPAAQGAALAYINTQAPGISAQVAADGSTVQVRVARNVPLAFLRIIGLDSVRLSATGTAQLRGGFGG
jgi:uncharacterized membrane protein